MSERRVLIVGAGAVTARIVAALALKDIEAQVLMVADDAPPPKDPWANLPKLTLQRGDNAPTPAFARERRTAQWKNEIHGRKKP